MLWVIRAAIATNSISAPWAGRILHVLLLDTPFVPRMNPALLHADTKSVHHNEIMRHERLTAKGYASHSNWLRELVSAQSFIFHSPKTTQSNEMNDIVAVPSVRGGSTMDNNYRSGMDCTSDQRIPTNHVLVHVWNATELVMMVFVAFAKMEFVLVQIPGVHTEQTTTKEGAAYVHELRDEWMSIESVSVIYAFQFCEFVQNYSFFRCRHFVQGVNDRFKCFGRCENDLSKCPFRWEFSVELRWNVRPK